MPDARGLNHVRLSKAMSKALRHRPERLGIELAEDGSVGLATLVRALNERGGWPREVTERDVLEVVEHGSKRRFAVEGGRIRALYGHSLARRVALEPAAPPDVLYHGTSRASVDAIMREGILPMGRQVAHLSTDVATAASVGARHGGGAAILEVDARRAAEEGVRFYRGNNETWLADWVPPEFLSEVG